MSEEIEETPENRLPVEAWGFRQTLGWSAFIALAFVSVQVVASIIYVLATGQFELMGEEPSPFDSRNDGDLLFTATLASTLLCTPLVFLISSRRGRDPFETLGLNRPDAIRSLKLIGFYTIFLIASEVIGRLFGRPVVAPFMKGVVETASSAALLGLAVVVLAPIFEEVFFRGFMFRGLASSKLGHVGAIITTSLLFALIHAQYDLYDMGQILAMGLVLGVTRHVTGSTTYCIILHAFGNLVGLIQAWMMS